MRRAQEQGVGEMPPKGGKRVGAVNVQKRSKMFKNVRKCSKMFENVRKCSKMLKNVQKCSKMFENVQKCSKIRGALRLRTLSFLALPS